MFKKGIDPDERGGGEELRGVGRRETVIRMYGIQKSISIKENIHKLYIHFQL